MGKFAAVNVVEEYPLVDAVDYQRGYGNGARCRGAYYPVGRSPVWPGVE